MDETLEIGIVGGSIAGCSAAILLSRGGHRVHVYECSRARLAGRGGGLGVPEPALREMIEQDMVGEGMPRLQATSTPFVRLTDAESRLDHAARATPVNLETFRWSALWNELRARVPAGVYEAGRRVVRFGQTAGGQRVELGFVDGACASFDLVLFADGHQSFGRAQLFPEVEPRYRGYMLWRGLVPEAEVGACKGLEGTVERISYRDLPGHFAAYLIPSETGATAPGARTCNWAAYLPLAEETLDDFLIDRDGHPLRATIPSGRMRLEEEGKLKALMAANLPDAYANMVARTRDTFVQLVHTASVPEHHRGRVCLIGDAGMMAQPFTGSGVLKGYRNASSLLAALDEHDTVEAALKVWGPRQVELGRGLLALGEQLERTFVLDTSATR